MGKGAQLPGPRITLGALNDCGAPKNPNNVTRTFFNTVHFLPEDLRFENGGAKLASCPERHLASLRPCQSGDSFREETHPLTFMLQNCGLTNCTGNSPETGFSFSVWRFVKS